MIMKRILFGSFVLFMFGLRGFAAGMPVFDIANWEQAILQLITLSNQLAQHQQLLKQLGDAATIQQVVGAAQTLAELAQAGLGKSQADINATITGQAGLRHDGQGLYQPVDPVIQLPNGRSIPRSPEDYKKFEAVQKAASRLDSVTLEALDRRKALRAAQLETAKRLEVATSDAEIQKLKGIQAAQAGEQATLHSEISEAAMQVLVQRAKNEDDRARQEQADLEARTANLHHALTNALKFFQADSRPSMIPDPRTKKY